MHPSQKPKKRLGSSIGLVGAQVANFRRAAGLTQREPAEQLCASEDLIASIEQGRRALKLNLAEQLDELLETKRALAVAVANLPEIDNFPVWAMEFIDLERDAITISSYQNQVLPGLLQTEAYARATFISRVPALGEDEIEQQVSARVARQDILRRRVPPTASFIVSEAILLDRLGRRQDVRGTIAPPPRMLRPARAHAPGHAVRPPLPCRPRRPLRPAGEPRPPALRVHRDPAWQPAHLRRRRGQHPGSEICDAAITGSQSRGHQGPVGPAARRATSDTRVWFKSSYSGSEGGDCLEVAYTWRKSSHSGSEGGECVEVGYAWRKSSHSGDEGGDCVEVSAHPAAVHVRDSKDPAVGDLTFTRAPWTAFAAFAAERA